MDHKLNKQHLIKNLMKFSEETTKTLNNILSEVDWNEDITERNSVNTICPFDPNHRVPDQNLEQHLDKCQWKAEGYDEQDLPLSIPTVPPDGPSCIKFDESLIQSILEMSKLQQIHTKLGNDKRLVPRTSDRLIADFKSEERRILYDYVIANTIPFEIGEEIADLEKLQKENGERKNVSYLELIAQERNLKRRRVKHRGVHTNKKSHLEVLREVINHQMEMLTDHVNEKQPSESVKPEKSYENNFEKFNNSVDRVKKDNYSRDYVDKQRKYESQRSYDDQQHLKRQERSRHSEKSSRHRDKYDERYQNNYDEKQHRTQRDSHNSDHHRKHKHHKDRHRSSSSSKKSRHDDERPSKRRKHHD